MSRTAFVKKPYCKVCQDAGKPESDYTSHWVKDLSGNTTCPTLLSTECRYCFKMGHTAKFCSVLAKNNKEKDRTERKLQVVNSKPKQIVQKKPHNGFAGLCDDDDSDSDEEEVSESIEYPSLSRKLEVEVPRVKLEVKTGWADVVTKPAEVKKQVEPIYKTGLVLLSECIKPEVKKEQAKPAPWTASKPMVKKSWADETDDETDDEIDDMLPEVDFKRGLEDDTW